jgi:phosphoribosylaminoimidazole-succinocarboxamide synthase
MGSVKDLQVMENPGEECGVGRFVYSDRYSVFDWGEMPDHIKNKGEALCLMGSYCFEKLEEQGIKTHYRGMLSSDGRLLRTDELEEPTNIMEVSLVNVIRPKFENGRYDYSVYEPNLENFLIPLEVIYRNGLPSGSSVFKRLKRGDVTYEELGLEHYPKPGENLNEPLFDVSTKLEEEDRYITWNEAQKIACLKDDEVKEIKEVLFTVDKLITNIAKRANLVNEDGKIELAYGPGRELMLVDVIGTLDECRFTCDGLHVSKEAARIFYRDSEWFGDVERAKKTAEDKGLQNWKELCVSKPPNLNPELLGIISDMYTSTANEFLGRKIFDSPKLKDVVKDYGEFIKRS